MIRGNVKLIRGTGYSVVIIAILAEVLFLYRHIFSWMKMAWFNYPPDGFGPYVPVIFLCIFAFRLFRNQDISIKTNPAGLVVIISGMIVFLTGRAADINVMQAMSLIIGGFGVVFYLMGSEWTRIMFFPFCFLFLMLPTTSFVIESALGVHLRNLITFVSGSTLNLFSGEWSSGSSVISISNVDIPVRYYRQSISSPLAVMILVFCAAEVMFLKNRSKLLFTVLFYIPLFVLSHSLFLILLGFTFEHGCRNLSQSLWISRGAFPSLILAFILIFSGLIFKKLKKIRKGKTDGNA